MSHLDDHALIIACSWCGAAPGEWCTTKSGARATMLHANRFWTVNAVWVDGYEEGIREAVAIMDSPSAWGEQYLARYRKVAAS